jgi:hypothetical protein
MMIVKRKWSMTNMKLEVELDFAGFANDDDDDTDSGCSFCYYYSKKSDLGYCKQSLPFVGINFSIFSLHFQEFFF